jgi:hypothetical protein
MLSATAFRNFEPQTCGFLANSNRRFQFARLVRAVGIEPTLLAEPDFESGASTNSTTPALETSLYRSVSRLQRHGCSLPFLFTGALLILRLTLAAAASIMFMREQLSFARACLRLCGSFFWQVGHVDHFGHHAGQRARDRSFFHRRIVGWLARPIVIVIVIGAACPAPGASPDRRAGRRGHRRPSSRSDRKHASPQDVCKAVDHPQKVARIAKCRPPAGGKSPSRKSRACVEALQ